jgi:hypothetical protein
MRKHIAITEENCGYAAAERLSARVVELGDRAIAAGIWPLPGVCHAIPHPPPDTHSGLWSVRLFRRKTCVLMPSFVGTVPRCALDERKLGLELIQLFLHVKGLGNDYAELPRTPR